MSDGVALCRSLEGWRSLDIGQMGGHRLSVASVDESRTLLECDMLSTRWCAQFGEVRVMEK